MDSLQSAFFSPIIMEEGDDSYILSGIEEHFPDIYQPHHQDQHTAFADDYEFVGSTDQIMKEMMEEDDENNLSMQAVAAQLFESGAENVTSQISASSETVADSSTTTASPTDLFNCNYESIPSPSSFDFISMILQEPLNEIAAVGNVDDDNTGGNPEVTRKRSRSMSRNETQVQDHILSERKRREKLSKLFIALAAMVPGLKKTDKGSILTGTIEHLKELKVREALLNKEVNKNSKNSDKHQRPQKTIDQMLSSSPSCESLISSNNATSSINDISDVDVKFEGRHVLIRIKCESRKKGVIVNLLHGSERMGLKVENCCAMPFDDSYLVITIIAEMQLLEIPLYAVGKKLDIPFSIAMNELFSLSREELQTKLRGLISINETRSK